MALQDYINNVNGKVVGTNPTNTGQCTGCVELYVQDLGLPFIPGNAVDLLRNADRSRYTVIINNVNNANQLPQPGDILVFNQKWGNGLGHTGIVVAATASGFTLLEQNNPVGSACHELHHPEDHYLSVSGWIRPNQPHPAPAQSGWAHVNSQANVRTSPNTGSSITSTLAAGTTFQYKAIVSGQNVNGNDKWVQSIYDHYVWSGNLTV